MALLTTPEIPAEPNENLPLIRRLIRRLRRSLSGMNQYCQSVEQAKDIAERENTKKYGKDWVNRCCG